MCSNKAFFTETGSVFGSWATVCQPLIQSITQGEKNKCILAFIIKNTSPFVLSMSMAFVPSQEQIVPDFYVCGGNIDTFQGIHLKFQHEAKISEICFLLFCFVFKIEKLPKEQTICLNIVPCVSHLYYLPCCNWHCRKEH